MAMGREEEGGTCRVKWREGDVSADFPGVFVLYIKSCERNISGQCCGTTWHADADRRPEGRRALRFASDACAVGGTVEQSCRV